ncbi:unnamed protein product [Closterium sp. NIES-53]
MCFPDPDKCAHFPPLLPLPLPHSPPQGTNLALVENCAITLGRFAWVCPDVLAPQASLFLVPFLATLKGIRDDVEKEEAFKGLCAVLRLNPMAASTAIHPLLLAIGSWREIHSAELKAEIHQLLQGFKQMLVEAGTWDQILQSTDKPLLQKLSATYGI